MPAAVAERLALRPEKHSRRSSQTARYLQQVVQRLVYVAFHAVEPPPAAMPLHQANRNAWRAQSRRNTSRPQAVQEKLGSIEAERQHHVLHPFSCTGVCHTIAYVGYMMAHCDLAEQEAFWLMVAFAEKPPKPCDGIHFASCLCNGDDMSFTKLIVLPSLQKDSDITIGETNIRHS